MPVRITETRQLSAVESSPQTQPGRLSVALITPGWGSSGFYPGEVLEAAAASRVFPAGTHMYLDHPTMSDETERPERSVRDLAAVLVEDARWDGSALVAEAQATGGPFRELLTDPVFTSAVGVSIRATAETKQGEADGRRGTIVTSLVEGLSVDFVTHAGRGGRILEVMESARPSLVCERATARGVSEAKAGDTRQALQSALTAAHGGDKVYVWVRDFDESNVWFDVEDEASNGTYQQAYSLTENDGGALSVTLASEWQEVTVRTEYVPVESTTQTTEERQMPQIEEARLAQLEAAAGRVPDLEARMTEATRRAEEAEAALVVHAAREAARPLAERFLGESKILAAPTVARVVRESLQAVPLTQAGALDEAAFTAKLTAAREEAEAEVTAYGVTPVAPVAESVVRGFGSFIPAGGGGEVSREASDAARRRAFGTGTLKTGA